MSRSNASSLEGYDADARRRACSVSYARNWWPMALRGIAALAFGLIAIFAPQITLLSLAIVFAAYALLDGVASAVASWRAARHGEPWGLLAGVALVSFLAAGATVAWPGLTILVFVLLIAAREIVAGGLLIFSAMELRGDHGKGWLILSGVLSIAFGALLLITPFIGAVVLAIWLGAYAVALGVSLLILSSRLRARHVAASGSGAPPPAPSPA